MPVSKVKCKESACNRLILRVVSELESPVVGPQQPVAIVEKKTGFPSKPSIACLHLGSADSRWAGKAER